VDDTFARAKAEAAKAETAAKQAADATRKAAAHSALWMFVALLCGAFAASYAATWGGTRRDHVNVTSRSRNPMLAPQ
jgi:membrane protein involved in colicin uptake